MEFLYWIYSRQVGKYSLASKAIRFATCRAYNTIAPFVYKHFPTSLNSKGNKIIISLTSFPARIENVSLVIESLFAQSVQPDKVLLTLSLKQFNGPHDLPKHLIKQQDRGLEIIWTEDDLKSHKKYYYAMKKYPESIIVTVDDDFYYAKHMLKILLEIHRKQPTAVICHLAALKNGLDYDNWQNLLFECRGPSVDIMQYGGSGVLYPPNSLHVDAFNKNKISTLCPLADDIWLNCMTILNGKKIIKTDFKYYLMPLYQKNKTALKHINVGENMNTQQIRNLNEAYPNYP